MISALSPADYVSTRVKGLDLNAVKIHTSTSFLVSKIMKVQDRRSLHKPFIAFLHILEHLKNIPRADWVKRGVESPKSVSDHSYRMIILCLMLEVCYQRLVGRKLWLRKYRLPALTRQNVRRWRQFTIWGNRSLKTSPPQMKYSEVVSIRSLKFLSALEWNLSLSRRETSSRRARYKISFNS